MPVARLYLLAANPCRNNLLVRHPVIHMSTISTALSNVNGRLAMTGTILRVVLLAIRPVLIREQFIIQIQDVRFPANERHAAGILARLVHLHVQQPSHLVLVVNQVAPFLTRLEHDFQTIARRSDVDEQNAQCLQIMNP